MSAIDTASHIHRDAQGRAWIDDTNVKVIEVVLDHIAYGWSADEIHFQHPHLSLGQIHATLGYYFDHQQEFDHLIEESLEEANQLAAAARQFAQSPPLAFAGEASLNLALYMDVQSPAAITHGLCRRGVDVLTAQTDDAGRLADNVLLDRATALGRVLFSRDKDLLAEARSPQRQGNPFAGVIYAHQLRVSIGQCVSDLELLAKVYEPAEMANRVEHLPLK